jgi:hypothetical protein
LKNKINVIKSSGIETNDDKLHGIKAVDPILAVKTEFEELVEGDEVDVKTKDEKNIDNQINGIMICFEERRTRDSSLKSSVYVRVDEQHILEKSS